MIQGNFLLLLLYLFCSLVVAACTPTARPSQSTHVATAATAAETAAAPESQPADPSQELVCRKKRLPGHASSDATVRRRLSGIRGRRTIASPAKECSARGRRCLFLRLIDSQMYSPALHDHFGVWLVH